METREYWCLDQEGSPLLMTVILPSGLNISVAHEASLKYRNTVWDRDLGVITPSWIAKTGRRSSPAYGLSPPWLKISPGRRSLPPCGSSRALWCPLLCGPVKAGALSVSCPPTCERLHHRLSFCSLDDAADAALFLQLFAPSLAGVVQGQGGPGPDGPEGNY